jgi:sigma-B regulation protein RsbU (phosphoserine phosphatase)
MDLININIFADLLVKLLIIIVIAYALTRLRFFREVLDGKLTQKNLIILILIFGGLAIFCTYAGFQVNGAIANIRDMAPMIAGLVGGPVAGLGVGLIGGLHRLTMGGLTAVPCALSTILAGLIAGLIYIKNKKKFIGIWGAVIFAILMETLHMVLILILATPFAQAVEVVTKIYVPMVVGNVVGMFIFAFMITNVIKKLKQPKETVSKESK